MLSIILAQINNPVIGNLGTDTQGVETTASLLAIIIRLLVVVGAILMILYLIVGAINWISAEGKPEKLEKARNQIIQAITGMVILAAVIAIAFFIGNIFGLNLLNIDLPTIEDV